MSAKVEKEDVVLGPDKNKEQQKDPRIKGPGYVPDSAQIREIEDRLTKVRLALLIRQPFWGQLASRLILQDASGWCGTAATDGRLFYYNVDFIEELDDEELKFLFGHEIEHCAFDHFIRRDHRDPGLWNAAADFCVNYDLVQGNIGKMPKVGLYDEKYKDMYAEEVYEDLYKNAEKVPMTLDEHLDVNGEEDDESGGGGEGEYKPGDEHNRPSVGKNAQEAIQDEMKSAIIQSAKQAEQSATGAGTIPAGLARLIKQWTKPQLDWRQFLEARILSTLKDDYSWMVPSRRGELEGGIILPGMTRLETIKVHIGVDTSGSMTEGMLKDLMGEVAGIMEQFPDFEVHVWCFDGDVVPSSYKVFTQMNVDEIYEYQLQGGGGTQFESNWNFMKANDIEPITFLLFTDGYPHGSWGDPNYCETIFLIHGNEEIEAPFGLTLYYKKKKNE